MHTVPVFPCPCWTLQEVDQAVHQLECSAIQTHDIGLSDTVRLLLRVLQTQLICRQEVRSEVKVQSATTLTNCLAMQYTGELLC